MAAGDDAKPSEHTTDDGQTFYNSALTGSGTILPDGTYGDPLPDPTVQRGGVRAGTTSGGRKIPDPTEGLAPLPDSNAPKKSTSTRK